MITTLTISVLAIVLYYILIGNIDRSEPNVIKLEKPIQVIGLGIYTKKRSLYKDIDKVSNNFNKIKRNNPIPNLKEPWASVNIGRDYKENGNFAYITGDVVTKSDSVPDGLNYFEIPTVTYAVFPIRPKSKIARGATIKRMKRFVYTEWFPKSGYKPSDIIRHFELYDDKSLGKHPEINLYVALEEK